MRTVRADACFDRRARCDRRCNGESEVRLMRRVIAAIVWLAATTDRAS
jgi:hypothetical protein